MLLIKGFVRIQKKFVRKFEYGKIEYDPLEHDAFLDDSNEGESI